MIPPRRNKGCLESKRQNRGQVREDEEEEEEEGGHRSSVTSAGSSKDRIIIPDQVQRRSNLDEAEVHRHGIPDPEHVPLRYTHTDTRIVRCESLWQMTSGVR